MERQLASYAGIVASELLSQITRLGDELRGLRVVHINATPIGGGVAEILRSLVPLMRSVGIEAEWYAMEADEAFFRISKALHHCLQGDGACPSPEEIDLYLSHNEEAACSLRAMGVSADLWVVHDVQVLPILSYLGSPTGVWVCHIDTTRPNEMVRERLLPYMGHYRVIVASMAEYFPEGRASASKVVIFPPAIDPLLPKHRPLARPQARQVLARLGIDPARPLVSQVSRFDRWKDPWGVIDAYRLARAEVPGLQLALVGAMTAKDDWDARQVPAIVKEHAAGDADIHPCSDQALIGALEVNAFQSASEVNVQKSIREGFGLTVAEAMWKGTPVVGGDCGGIRLQIRDGETGFLVSDVPSCGQRMVSLLKDRVLARRMGSAGRELVRKNYLMPRLVRDYLRLSATVVSDVGVATQG